jgi:hypothetical protein
MADIIGAVSGGGGGGGGSGYSIIQDNGTPFPSETTINFTGIGVTVSDNPGVATIVNIPGGGSSAVPFAQVLYVDPNGNDSTGNGTVVNPYLTIGNALSKITTSSSTKPYVVMINAGTYSETGLEVPVWVFLVGAMQQPTKIIDSSGSIKINSASFSAGSERIGFQNLNLINSTGLDINFQSIGGSGSNDIYLVNCQIAGNVTLLGRGSDYITGDNNQIFGTYTSSAMQEIWFGGYFANNCVFNTAGVTGQAIGPEFTGVDFFGGVEFTSSGSGNTMAPTMISSQVSGTLQVDQATTTLSADEVSLNAGTLSQTNGGLVTYLSLAKYEGYTPAISGNWPTVPTQVAQALDEVASTGVMGPFTAGSVIFSNGTKLTQDNANFNWNDSTYTLSIMQPSSLLTVDTVLKVTSDPSGSHGHGNHLELAGNPGGGATIFRTDGGLNESWIQIFGGGTSTLGGAIYLNGNNSTGGGTGGVQTTFGLNTSSFQMYDYTESILLFQLNNSGVLQLPMITTYSALASDGSGNVTPISSSTAGYVLTSNGAVSAPTFQPASGGGFSWSVITSNTVLAANMGYIVNAVGQLTLTLPTTFPAGAEIRIVGYAGGWTINQNAGQSIAWGSTSTTLGTSGHLTSTLVSDCLDIVAVNANTTFVVADSNGNITVA